MPVRKVKGGYKYGTTGKVYPTKAQAEKQGRAIKANQEREKRGLSNPVVHSTEKAIDTAIEALRIQIRKDRQYS